METSRIKTSPQTEKFDTPQETRGLGFYIRGSWSYFKRMWPAIYDLTETETYVNASAIAFNILLSFFSFTVLIGSFLINVLHWQRGYETSFRLLRSLVPKESGLLFRSLDQVTQGPGGKATLVSFALLIFSASGVFQPLELALNRAWGFKERGIIRQYAVYLVLVIVCTLIILFPVLIGSFYDFLLEMVLGQSPAREMAFKIIGPLISLPFVAIVFFVIYYFVPNGKVKTPQVVFTSVAMSLLWLIGMFLFKLALPLLDFESSYKQLSSLMALITWIFVTAFILILGANLSVREVLPRRWTGLLPKRWDGSSQREEVESTKQEGREITKQTK
ncbi:MAG: YihY/virulence factor BrkB family protein [Acidobacteria bacterium]|nr:YihY/virulence factor BrkB family protein [Acidobacteriota bacterium]